MLVIDGLEKRYGSVAALDGLSMSARPGRLVGFLGANGAGKTTTMRAIFGLVDPDAGEVAWNGAPVDAAMRRRFGYMPEQRGLYARIPIGEQLRYFGELHGMTRRHAEAAAGELLDELGLTDRRDDRLENLSHGNQQRIQLGVALVHQPQLLVLDEPFSGLDPLGVATMIGVLRARAANGVAVLFSSHQLDLVEEMCDDVVVIHRGRDVLAGTLDEVRSRTGRRVAEVRLTQGSVRPPAIDGVEPVAVGGSWRYDVAADVTVEDVLSAWRSCGEVLGFSFRLPSLAEVFRSAVGEAVSTGAGPT